MPNKSLNRILYIEDDEGLARLLQKRLERSGLQIELSFTGEDGLERIKSNEHDLILLDHHLPAMSGLDVLDKLKPLEDYPPIILLTASGDERIALTALEKGAADYAVKDTGQFYFDLLPAIMQAAFTKHRLTRENILQRQELELARQKSDSANQAKSDFLANMSHEIRTPLNVVIGVANLLASNNLTPKQEEMVGLLRSNASLLLKLINELLDLSRIESGQLQLELKPFVLSSILRETHDMFARQAEEKKIRLIVHDLTENIQLEGDSTRIQQILINLVANAIKFTSKGEITIHAELDHADDQVIIAVKDTGIGIAAEKIEAVFGKFVQADQSITRNYGGTGLGLAITQSLVELMKGTLHVESEVGRGSVFKLALPLARLTQSEKKVVSSSESTACTEKIIRSNNSVLVVEDSRPNIFVFEMILEKWNYNIDIAMSGEEALEKIRKSTQPYQAILMDVQMAHMDGYETTRTIRKMEKEKGFTNHIIGVTAHALAGDREKCIASGMNDYMTKPIQFDILEEKLKQAKYN